MKWVKVVLAVPFEGEFTYSVPEKYEEEVLCGRRVMVPFGSSRKTALVSEETENEPEGQFSIKAIDRVVDKEAVFNTDLLDTARWMKAMYLSPVGVNLSMMIPLLWKSLLRSRKVPWRESAPFQRAHSMCMELQEAEKARFT